MRSRTRSPINRVVQSGSVLAFLKRPAFAGLLTQKTQDQEFEGHNHQLLPRQSEHAQSHARRQAGAIDQAHACGGDAEGPVRRWPVVKERAVRDSSPVHGAQARVACLRDHPLQPLRPRHETTRHQDREANTHNRADAGTTGRNARD